MKQKESATQKKIDRYLELYDSFKRRSKYPEKVVFLGASLLTSLPIAEGAVVYSGAQNLNVAWVNGANADAFVNFTGAGGNNIRFFGNDSANLPVFNPIVQASVNAFNGTVNGGFGYPFANATSAVFDGADNWNLGATANSLANERYDVGNWRNAVLANGETRVLGVRLNVSANTHYGWVRITKNTDRDWTIIDWAWENSPNTAISPATTLPVELISFSAKPDGNQINLNWQTASEINNAGFEIERSIDGKNFNDLLFIEGKGNIDLQQDYSFEDKNLRKGQLYYYRLKQIDFDGQFQYSEIITAQLDGENGNVLFFPNPIKNNQTQLNYTATSSGKLNLQIFDSTGKQLAKQVHFVAKGNNMIELSFSALNKGDMLFVKLEKNGISNYHKLMKE